MKGLTSSLAECISSTRFNDLPLNAVNLAKFGIADCFGVMLAGSREPSFGIVDKLFGAGEGPESAKILYSGVDRRADHAALINGMIAHTLDYDDVALGGHPSAVLMPAAFAATQASRGSGEDLLKGYVVGYEVWAQLMEREPQSLHEKGWHATAVRGSVGAAAACASIKRLNEEQCVSALAIAASLASGLVANFGSMTKAFQVGHAAQSGYVAAQLAQAGFTGSSDALEHVSGFLAAFSPRGGADLSAADDSSREGWAIERWGLNLKRYPLCYATHRVVDSLIALSESHNLCAENVSAVRISTGTTQMKMVRNHQPRTGLEAKFSVEFAAAAAIVARKVGFKELRDDFVARDDVQGLIRRVEIETRDETMEGSGLAPFDSVDVVLRDGKRLAGGQIKYARGHFKNPLSKDELFDKFIDCVATVEDSSKAYRLFTALMSVERMKSISDFD